MGADSQPSIRGLRQKGSKAIPHHGSITTISSATWVVSLSTTTVEEIHTDKPRPSSPKRGLQAERPQSKMSLFDLFSKPKVEKLRGYHEGGLDAPAPTKTALKESKAAATTQQTQRSGRNTPSARASEKPDDPARKSKPPRSFPVRLEKRTNNGGPPPLFQAFPQAIKHGKLLGSNMSPEALSRAQRHRRQLSNFQSKVESRLDLSSLFEGGDARKKVDGNKADDRRMSASSGSDVSSKVYVLSTSGQMLQYSGEGSSARVPEKVLQLTKESAAFASDLIPGKHWVLQISQTASPQGITMNAQPRSLLSRLRMPSTAKKPAPSFLLVLDSAEEMDSWLKAVRKEIDILSGKRNRSQMRLERAETEESEKESQNMPSHRFQVQRDPTRFDSERSSNQSPSSPTNQVPPLPTLSSPAIVTPEDDGAANGQKGVAADSASTTSSRPLSIRQSVEAPSLATTVASVDQLTLNQLRDSSRHSIISSRTDGSGTVTLATSRGSSPAPPSPRPDTVAKPDTDTLRSPSALKSSYMSPNASFGSRRRSMMTLPTTRENGSNANEDRAEMTNRHSVIGSPTRSGTPRLTVDTQLQRPAPTAERSRPADVVRTAPTVRSPELRESTSIPQGLVDSPTYHQSTPTRNLPAPLKLLASTQPDTARQSRPPSGISQLPHISTLDKSRRASARVAFRLPIRPSEPNALPRRLSSLPDMAQQDSPSTLANLSPPPQPQRSPPPQPPVQGLRRPASVQIRTDHAPFLSSRSISAPYQRSSSAMSFHTPRPIRNSVINPSPVQAGSSNRTSMMGVSPGTAVTSNRISVVSPSPATPMSSARMSVISPPPPPASYVTSHRRAPSRSNSTSQSTNSTLSSQHSRAPSRSSSLASHGSSIPQLRQGLQIRKSMPVIGLPPPAPPPDMPLPPPPPPRSETPMSSRREVTV